MNLEKQIKNIKSEGKWFDIYRKKWQGKISGFKATAENDLWQPCPTPK